MEDLFIQSDRLLAETPMEFVRNAMETINWNARLISVKGPKGTGKSTLLKQFAKKNYRPGSRKVLYCSLDSLTFAGQNPVEIAGQFLSQGGERLILDEVHKFPNWSRAVKEIYDTCPALKVVISGSSLLKINSGDADLSRRVSSYKLGGLSFREFIRFETGHSLPIFPLEQVLASPWEVAMQVRDACTPLELFGKYLRTGYYPYYFDNRKDYAMHLEGAINYTIENELVVERHVDVANTRKIKLLLKFLATAVPFQLDIAKLSRSLEMKRETVLTYLNYLGEADLLTLLYSDLQSIGRFQKPDKVYLDNPNLMYLFKPSGPDIGTLRETFFVSQLSKSHTVEYGKNTGDFNVDGDIVIEVGGRDKGMDQVKEATNPYVAADDIDLPVGNRKIPLWEFGFLY